LVIELLVARLSIVARLANALINYYTTAVTLTVKEGAAAVVMGRHSLQRTWHCLELADHFLIL
jgi:hypothetical protein